MMVISPTRELRSTNMLSTAVVPWTPNEPIALPKNVSDVKTIAPLAHQLRPTDIQKVIKAFDAELYELAAEFVWKRTMSALKHQLSLMGMGFVGEMLSRPDIDENVSIELVITDYEAIQLALQLGIINRLGSIQLRQAAELLSYYSGSEVEGDEELDMLQALNLIRSCVSNILAREKIESALNFADFRRNLTQHVLSIDNQNVIALDDAPYFFKRTTVRVLLADAKDGKGAQLENALSNLSIILPKLWDSLADPDKWQIGQVYAEANANNLKTLTSTLRRLLISLQGFDYVPETLRSSTYTRAASEVLVAHGNADNYQNEIIPMKALALLGSTIPGPAFQLCMRATLAVKLGNYYGRSWGAQIHADKLLKSLASDRWTVYYSRFLWSDDLILDKLTQEKPAQNFVELLSNYRVDVQAINHTPTARLVEAALSGKTDSVTKQAKRMYKNIITASKNQFEKSLRSKSDKHKS